MVQNGILLTFTRLVTVCLYFWRYAFEFPVPSLPCWPEKCTSSYPKSFQPKPTVGVNNWSLSASLHYSSTRHGPNVNGSQSTSSLHYVHYALKHLSFPLFNGLVGISYSHHFLFPLPLSVCSSVHLHLFMCVSRVFCNALDKEKLSDRWTFLSTEWNLATGICHSRLIYPPNWKAREEEEWNASEGSAVCFADLGQPSYWKMLSVCVVCSWRRLRCTVHSAVQGEAEARCNWSNLQQ